ncbi:hypothetical protein JG688_00013650 [Phytophthora aleatoria]|uniref:Uncharacterized protein n=1 Tax=Phytophthora aleatoria TaxID=2496075 RepID=A0A8J5ILY2_9STRA|nr:hypothetical protein JG688_00013650 [Phytophthora aleatoria]
MDKQMTGQTHRLSDMEIQRWISMWTGFRGLCLPEATEPPVTIETFEVIEVKTRPSLSKH